MRRRYRDGALEEVTAARGVVLDQLLWLHARVFNLEISPASSLDACPTYPIAPNRPTRL